MNGRAAAINTHNLSHLVKSWIRTHGFEVGQRKRLGRGTAAAAAATFFILLRQELILSVDHDHFRSPQNLPHEEGKRVHVRPAEGLKRRLLVDTEVKHLRTHVPLGPNPGVLGDVELVAGLLVGDGQAEVGDDAGSILAHENVLGFDVPVGDAGFALRRKKQGLDS